MKDEKNQGKSKDSLTPFFRALALSLFLFLPLLLTLPPTPWAVIRNL